MISAFMASRAFKFVPYIIVVVGLVGLAVGVQYFAKQQYKAGYEARNTEIQINNLNKLNAALELSLKTSSAIQMNLTAAQHQMTTFTQDYHEAIKSSPMPAIDCYGDVNRMRLINELYRLPDASTTPR